MSASCSRYIDVVMYICCFVEKNSSTSQYWYMLRTFYYAQCDVLCDFCMKWFCCSMKTKTIVPNVFGVCVNFKIRTFQWSAVQLCGEMALGKGGGERQLL